MSGWGALGSALGGDSEIEYQKGLALGAQTQNALAQARERVEKAKAQEGFSLQLEALGVPPTLARASSTAVQLGQGLGDVIGMQGQRQEYDLRSIMGSADPAVDVATRNRAAFGLVNAPQATLEAVGSRGYQDVMDPTKGVMPLGEAIVGRGSGGADAGAIQVLRSFRMLDENDQVLPGFERQAFDIMRSTGRIVDEGGVPGTVNFNPFSGQQAAQGGLGNALAPLPGAGVQAPAAAPVPAAAAPAAAPMGTVAPASVTPVSTVDRVAGNEAAIAAAKKEAEMQAQIKVQLPQTRMRVQNATNQINQTMGLVDKAIANVGPWTAGPAGVALGFAPGTPAYDLKSLVKTIQSDVGFRELQNMRLESPTGGALGQVAVKELEFLQARIGNLDNAQSPSQLVEMLKLVQEAYNKFQEAATANLEALEIQAVQAPGVAPAASAAAPAAAPAGAVLSFATEAEAAAAGLPNGTKVTIGGVTGTWVQ